MGIYCLGTCKDLGLTQDKVSILTRAAWARGKAIILSTALGRAAPDLAW